MGTRPGDVSAVVADVRAASGGDCDAYGRLVERTSAGVMAALLSIVHDLDRAEDLAQEVYVTGWKRLGSLRDPATFDAWIRQIARNRARLEERSRRRRGAREARFGEGIGSIRDPAQLALEREERRVLAACLEQLPEADNEVLLLFYWRDLSIREVALELGISAVAAKKRLSRARERIRTDWTRVERGLARTRPSAALVVSVLVALTSLPRGAGAARPAVVPRGGGSGNLAMAAGVCALAFVGSSPAVSPPAVASVPVEIPVASPEGPLTAPRRVQGLATASEPPRAGPSSVAPRTAVRTVPVRVVEAPVTATPRVEAPPDSDLEIGPRVLLMRPASGVEDPGADALAARVRTRLKRRDRTGRPPVFVAPPPGVPAIDDVVLNPADRCQQVSSPALLAEIGRLVADHHEVYVAAATGPGSQDFELLKWNEEAQALSGLWGRAAPARDVPATLWVVPNARRGVQTDFLPDIAQQLGRPSLTLEWGAESLDSVLEAARAVPRACAHPVEGPARARFREAAAARPGSELYVTFAGFLATGQLLRWDDEAGALRPQYLEWRERIEPPAELGSTAAFRPQLLVVDDGDPSTRAQVAERVLARWHKGRVEPAVGGAPRHLGPVDARPRECFAELSAAQTAELAALGAQPVDLYLAVPGPPGVRDPMVWAWSPDSRDLVRSYQLSGAMPRSLGVSEAPATLEVIPWPGEPLPDGHEQQLRSQLGRPHLDVRPSGLETSAALINQLTRARGECSPPLDEVTRAALAREAESVPSQDFYIGVPRDGRNAWDVWRWQPGRERLSKVQLDGTRRARRRR